MKDIELESNDVFVERIDEKQCECGADETHRVMLDLRNIGRAVEIFRGCNRCASALSVDVRRALPSFHCASGCGCKHGVSLHDGPCLIVRDEP
jgi:hypothetical protein